MNEKVCPKCKENKPITGWARNKGKPDGLGSWCKTCTQVLVNKWYNTPGNKDKHKAKLYARRTRNKNRLMEHFNNECLDCKTSYANPCVYDFHHLEPEHKDKNFGKINTGSWARIEKEIIGKCVMLCANCHRVRHHGRE